MKQILLFGAGKSATSLIRYLVDLAASRQWQLVVAESSPALAESKLKNAPHTRAVGLRVENEEARTALIQQADIVISLLPPALHNQIALSCLAAGKHLLTASYVDPALRALERQIGDSGLLFLCEMGLDPGIDHMSAMQMISDIKSKGGQIQSFHSHTGGLIAPESDNNPWHYKISWNPRNVVLAGSAGAQYLENGGIVTVPYERLFASTGEISLPSTGPLAWYPNRDSLSYIPIYGLQEASTFIRTTLRYPIFCQAWAAIVSAGLTDDRQPLTGTPTYAAWSAPILPWTDDSNRPLFEFLGLFDNTPVPSTARSSADVLQFLLETRLAMSPQDRDMIVMQHEITYKKEGKLYTEKSTLIVKGEDSSHTAMARTVGLPLGIAARLILEGNINLTGLHIPILPEIYDPVLDELEQLDVRFTHTTE
ncbi:saccharopine dehydrogenase C-terminal domain-containing protein [Puia sp. P3]|uniref:saccharopine dehydrogenase C-terminal domain-containing protein n=1 Tax=Puia sp. P3 TaxID=3423952 RepID=UPI003D677CC0